MSVTLNISIGDELLPILEERARNMGKEREEYLAWLTQRQLTVPRTFAEILAPLRADFASSGMTDEEFQAMVEEARDEAWAGMPR